MLKGIKINKWIVLIAAVAVVLLIAVGVCKIMFGNYVSIRGQQLNTYSYSSGGGMNGGYHRETVKRYDDYALISIESAEWYTPDPAVTEYMTDAKVLDELESVVRRYKMNFWNRKKFTNMFVNDKESESYSFDFDDENISFSSQIYPMRYRKKLAELDSVIEKYIEAGEKLPGLVNSKTDEEEHYLMPEGELVMYVCSYAINSLGFSVLNGTNEDIEIPEMYKLINGDTGEVLLEKETPYGGSFNANTRYVMSVELDERLNAGSYKLIIGELNASFEIR